MSIFKKAQRARKPLLAALLTLPALASAGPVPGAGSILQQINPSLAPAPSGNQTGLRLQKPSGEKIPSTMSFQVKKINITGNTKFDAATLHALVADAEGKNLTLTDLEGFASKITDYYHAHGYPLARAIIPAQTIRDGEVTIEVIEANYGKVKLQNRSKVEDSLLQSTLSPLASGKVIEQQSMDHALLLLSDIPGVAVSATLLPGEAVGTSDLVVQAEPGPAAIGNVTLDNYGNAYTGRVRAGGAVSFFNLLHHGDTLSVNGLSTGSGMNYGRLSYESVLNGYGTTAGAAYSALHYILGDALSNLNGHGTAQVGSLWSRHPFIRSRKYNLYGQIQYDRLKLQDHIDAASIRTDRHLDDWTATLSGDHRHLAGIDTWSLAGTSGRVSFDDAAAGAADAATARTAGGFAKWNLNYARLQGLGANNVLYFAFTGQWSNQNLDPSQQMVAGGPYTVRAYDMGVLSGDEGYLGTLEFRREIARYHGNWQAIAFYDSERVTVNRNPWVAGTNAATLSGGGVGLNWEGAKGWKMKTYLAFRTNSTQLVPAASSSRAWVEFGKGF